MLSKRIIPCLDIHDRKVTKGVKFKNNVVLGEPVEMARIAPPLPAPPVTAPPLPAPPTEPVARIADAPPVPTKAAAPISFRLMPLKPTPGALQLVAPAPSEKAEAFTAQAASDAGS